MGFIPYLVIFFFIQIKLVKVACNDDFWMLFFTKDSIKNPAKVVHYVWSVFLGSAGYVDWDYVNRYPLEVSKGPDNVIAESAFINLEEVQFEIAYQQPPLLSLFV